MAEETKKKPAAHLILIHGLVVQAAAYKTAEKGSDKDNALLIFLTTARYLAAAHVPEDERDEAAAWVERITGNLFNDDADFTPVAVRIQEELPLWLDAIRRGAELYRVVLLAIVDCVTRFREETEITERANACDDVAVLAELLPQLLIRQEERKDAAAALEHLLDELAAADDENYLDDAGISDNRAAWVTDIYGAGAEAPPADVPE